MAVLLIPFVAFLAHDPRTVRIKVNVKDKIVRVSFVEGELRTVSECQEVLTSAITSNQVHLVVADLPVSYPDKTDRYLGLVTKTLNGLVLDQKIRYVYYYSQKEHASVDDISFVFVEVPFDEPMNLRAAKVFLDGLELGVGDEGMQHLVESCQEKPPKYFTAIFGLYNGKGSWPSPIFRQALPEAHHLEIMKTVEEKGGKEIQMQYFME